MDNINYNQIDQNEDISKTFGHHLHIVEALSCPYDHSNLAQEISL